jgi:hypothetical protein
VKGVSFPPGFRLETLRRTHPRKAFDCAEPAVNEWLSAKALQSQQKRLSVTNSESFSRAVQSLNQKTKGADQNCNTKTVVVNQAISAILAQVRQQFLSTTGAPESNWPLENVKIPKLTSKIVSFANLPPLGNQELTARRESDQGGLIGLLQREPRPRR